MLLVIITQNPDILHNYLLYVHAHRMQNVNSASIDDKNDSKVWIKFTGI